MINPYTNFDFEAWRSEQAAKRAQHLAELLIAIEQGLTVRETWPSGRATDWSWTARADGQHEIWAESHWSDASPRHEAFIRGLSALYLAEHLENRSYGFGTVTTF